MGHLIYNYGTAAYSLKISPKGAAVYETRRTFRPP